MNIKSVKLTRASPGLMPGTHGVRTAGGNDFMFGNGGRYAVIYTVGEIVGDKDGFFAVEYEKPPKLKEHAIVGYMIDRDDIDSIFYYPAWAARKQESEVNSYADTGKFAVAEGDEEHPHRVEITIRRTE